MDWRQVLTGLKSTLEALFAGNLEVGLAIIGMAVVAIVIVTVIDRRQGRTMAADNPKEGAGSGAPKADEKGKPAGVEKAGPAGAGPTRPDAATEAAKPESEKPGAAGGGAAMPAAGNTPNPQSLPRAGAAPATASKPGETSVPASSASGMQRPPGLARLLGGLGASASSNAPSSGAPVPSAPAPPATSAVTPSGGPSASSGPGVSPAAKPPGPATPGASGGPPSPGQSAGAPAGNSSPTTAAASASVPSIGAATRAVQPGVSPNSGVPSLSPHPGSGSQGASAVGGVAASTSATPTSPGAAQPQRPANAGVGSPTPGAQAVQPARAVPPGASLGSPVASGAQPLPGAPQGAMPSPGAPPFPSSGPAANKEAPGKAPPAVKGDAAAPAKPAEPAQAAEQKSQADILPTSRVQSRTDAVSPKDADKDDALSLDGTALAPLDRVFPARPIPFLTLVTLLCASAWGGGYVLATDKGKFLASVEWRFMPFYLAAHLIAVRLFITAYTRNFRAGVRHLEVSAQRAARGVRTILGPVGLLLAMLIAAPFCYFDWQYLNRDGSRYERLGEGNSVGPIDHLMWGTWCVEWTLNALIWVMLVAFLLKNVVMIRSYAFRAPIELVLHERHYRPFLQMSSQGATIVLGFSAVTIFYLWYTGGELTDYAGLAITATLLFVGFIPPWILLRRKVRRAVESETLALRHAVLSAMWRDARAKKEGATSANIPLEQRLSEALAIFRVSHLEQLKLNLGLREARAVVFRLLAPVIGVAWQVGQSLEAVVARFDTTLKAAKAFLARFLL